MSSRCEVKRAPPFIRGFAVASGLIPANDRSSSGVAELGGGLFLTCLEFSAFEILFSSNKQIVEAESPNKRENFQVVGQCT
jgi:uncharacterized membrane protein YkvI